MNGRGQRRSIRGATDIDGDRFTLVNLELINLMSTLHFYKLSFDLFSRDLPLICIGRLPSQSGVALRSPQATSV